MAKKRAADVVPVEGESLPIPLKRGRGRPRNRDGPLPYRLAIRAPVEWNDWLSELAGLLGIERTAVIDEALVDVAAKHRFRPPPARTG